MVEEDAVDRNAESRSGMRMAFVALLALWIPLQASGLTGLEGRIRKLATDDTGRVWVSARRDEMLERLHVWDEEQGLRLCDYAPCDDMEHVGIRLHGARDGWVYVSWWHQPRKGVYMTRHRGDVTELVAQMRDPLGGLHELAVGPKGDFWFTGSRIVIRVLEDGTTERAKNFASRDYHPREGLDPDSDFRSPMLFPDPSVGVWAWGKSWPGSRSYRTLRGFCRLNGTEVEHYPTIPGLPDRPYTAVAHKYATTYWVAVKGEGLYEVNLRAMKGKRIDVPHAEAFRNVHQLSVIDGTLYVYASVDVSVNSWYTTSASLWRLDDNFWTCIASDLPNGVEQAILPTPLGTWIGTARKGLLFVPQGQTEPIEINWQRGLPLSNIENLIALDVGRIMASKRWGGEPTAAVFHPDEVMAEGRVAENVEVFETWTQLLQDDEKRLWTILSSNSNALSVWDGTQWTSYPLPAECPKHEGTGNVEWPRDILLDSLGRLWVWFWRIEQDYRFPDADGPVVLFDMAEKDWVHYETFVKAMEAQREHGDAFEFTSTQHMDPVFGEDGRMAFKFREPWKVYYLGKVSELVKESLPTRGGRYAPSWREHPGPDGLEWFGFLYHDVGNGEITYVYFGENGKLRLNTTPRHDNIGSKRKASWELDEETGWQEIDFIPIEPKGRTASVDFSMFDPRPQYRESVVQDAHGRYWNWYMQDGQLFKQGMGRAAAQFSEGERHPLLGQGRVVRAYMDPANNTILKADYGYTYMVLRPHAPAPETEIAVAYDEPDSVTVTMSSAAGGSPWLVWRLDDGNWSNPDKRSTVSLVDLSWGEHKFEAYAIDERLQVEETPCVAQIVVKVDAEEQTAQWIAALSNDDYEEREAAVKALVRAGEAVLPALKEARTDAGEELQWWLAAAIERIEAPE